MKLAAIIFDFDGTLAELNIDFLAMRQEVEDLARGQGWQGELPGGYLLEQVREMTPALGQGFRDQAYQLIMAREVAAAQAGRLFDFTHGLLADLRRLGLKTAVISRNCGAAIRRVFPGVEEESDAFLPREAVTRFKPDPGHVWAALERLERLPGQAAMVGDHPVDVATARAAGCLPVGVASGRISAPELRQAGAELVLADAGGLLKALGLA